MDRGVVFLAAVAFTENVEQRFLSYGWQTLHVDNGDS